MCCWAIFRGSRVKQLFSLRRGLVLIIEWFDRLFELLVGLLSSWKWCNELFDLRLGNISSFFWRSNVRRLPNGYLFVIGWIIELFELCLGDVFRPIGKQLFKLHRKHIFIIDGCERVCHLFRGSVLGDELINVLGILPLWSRQLWVHM